MSEDGQGKHRWIKKKKGASKLLYIFEPFAGVFKSPFAPAGATVVRIAATGIVGAVSQNMAVCAAFSLFFVGKSDGFGFVDLFREYGCYIDLSVYGICRVGIGDVAFCGIGLVVFARLVQNDTGHNRSRFGQVIVGDCVFIHLRTGVERDQAGFDYIIVPFHGQRIVNQLDCEAQRAVVQYLEVLVLIPF